VSGSVEIASISYRPAEDDDDLMKTVLLLVLRRLLRISDSFTIVPAVYRWLQVIGKCTLSRKERTTEKSLNPEYKYRFLVHCCSTIRVHVIFNMV
jgi:hypothetical protein